MAVRLTTYGRQRRLALATCRNVEVDLIETFICHRLFAEIPVVARLREEEGRPLPAFIRKVGDFSRFLEAISFSHAGVVNLNHVARECEVGRKAVEGYTGILEDLLLAFSVPVFTRRARRATSQRPKFYLVDAGVYRALRPAGPLDRPEEIDGAALEGLVAQHLRAWKDYGQVEADLHFWRTPSGNEVDFILYGRAGFWAIEVKNSARMSRILGVEGTFAKLVAALGSQFLFEILHSRERAGMPAKSR